MVKIHYRLVFLLAAILTMFFFHDGHTESLVEIPPPIPTVLPEEQKNITKTFMENYQKLNQFLGQEKKYLPEFPVYDEEMNLYYQRENLKHAQFSSRAGSIKQDFIIENLVSTARSIHGQNYTFSEKEFYKSNFSIAANIEAINNRLAETYGENNFPKIYKGVVVLIEIIEPNTAEIIYSGWGKINTDTASDFVDNSKNYPFAENKICLAVDSEDKIEMFKSKEVRIFVFISKPPSNDFLQQEMKNQGTIQRPKESIHF